jgi:hypothetical protein
MALGLALLFGFRLPINFLAPYRAGSMIEFWRRWHITLSAFLRDYVYIPLGGNRNRHLTNLFLTMLLAGLWHGAGWTFIFWGAWHGASSVINHLWRQRKNAPKLSDENSPGGARRPPLWAHVLTLLVVALGWVLFRAADLETALLIFQSMIGWHGISVPVSWHEWVEPFAPVIRARGLLPNVSAQPAALIPFFFACYFAVRGPQLLQWLGITPSDVTRTSRWHQQELAPAQSSLSPWRIVLAGIMFALGIAALSRSSVFLYFQF